MNEFLNVMADTCILAAIVGTIIVVPCYLMDKIAEKLNIKDKIVNFFIKEEIDDFDE